MIKGIYEKDKTPIFKGMELYFKKPYFLIMTDYAYYLCWCESSTEYRICIYNPEINCGADYTKTYGRPEFQADEYFFKTKEEYFKELKKLFSIEIIQKINNFINYNKRRKK
jgi:hypothetical protein